MSTWRERLRHSFRQQQRGLNEFRDFGQGDLGDDLELVKAMANPFNGLAYFRIESLDSNKAVADAVNNTVGAVLKIATQASVMLLDSQNKITARAREISGNAATLQQSLESAGLCHRGNDPEPFPDHLPSQHHQSDHRAPGQGRHETGERV